MYKLFLKNNAVGFAALLILLVLLRLRLIVNPSLYVVADTPDMYSPFWSLFFGNVVPGSTLSVVVALVCTFLCAIIVNNIVNRYGLMPIQSCLGGLFFVLLSGAFRPSIGFQPVMLFALSLIWSLDRLFSATRKERPYLSIAWGFAITACGALFWAKGIWFIPFLFVLILLLRIARLRHIMAAVMGIASVALIVYTAVVFRGSIAENFNSFIRAAVTTLPHWRIGPISVTYIVVVALLFFLSVISSYRRLYEFKVAESRKLRSAQWEVFFVIFLMLLPGFSYELQILVAAGASLFLPRFFYSLRNARIRECGILLLTAMTALLIYI